MEMLLSAIANTLSLCWIIIFPHVVGVLTFTQGFDKTTTPLEQRGKLDGKNLKVILGSVKHTEETRNKIDLPICFEKILGCYCRSSGAREGLSDYRC